MLTDRESEEVRRNGTACMDCGEWLISDPCAGNGKPRLCDDCLHDRKRQEERDNQ